MNNYYKPLGLIYTATESEIKSAYRKLSKKFHPDVNDGDKFFEERFKEIQEAYEKLQDKSYRDAYKNYIENSTKSHNPENKTNTNSTNKSYAKSENSNTKHNVNNNSNNRTQSTSEYIHTKPDSSFGLIITIGIVLLAIIILISVSKNDKQINDDYLLTKQSGKFEDENEVNELSVENTNETNGLSTSAAVDTFLGEILNVDPEYNAGGVRINVLYKMNGSDFEEQRPSIVKENSIEWFNSEYITKLQKLKGKHILFTCKREGSGGFLYLENYVAFGSYDSKNFFDNEFKFYCDKYTFNSNFFKNPLLTRRLKNLIGANYSFLMDFWTVTSPTECNDNVLIATGCQAHNCNYTNFIIAIDMQRDILHVGILNEKRGFLYSENPLLLPQKILQWKAANNISNVNTVDEDSKQFEESKEDIIDWLNSKLNQYSVNTISCTDATYGLNRECTQYLDFEYKATGEYLIVSYNYDNSSNQLDYIPYYDINYFGGKDYGNELNISTKSNTIVNINKTYNTQNKTSYAHIGVDREGEDGLFEKIKEKLTILKNISSKPIGSLPEFIPKSQLNKPSLEETRTWILSKLQAYKSNDIQFSIQGNNLVVKYSYGGTSTIPLCKVYFSRPQKNYGSYDPNPPTVRFSSPVKVIVNDNKYSGVTYSNSKEFRIDLDREKDLYNRLQKAFITYREYCLPEPNTTEPY